jgi:hypothetical protein
VAPGGDLQVFLSYIFSIPLSDRIRQSLMPLHFIAGLRRHLHASASPDEQRVLVDPILLNTCRCSHKYSDDIPEILALDEQREELETKEAVIWYAFIHEK